MRKTLVAVFDDQSEAAQALDALSEGGFSSSRARLTSSESSTGGTTSGKAEHDESLGEKVAHFFGFGEQHESTYSEAVRRGSWVLVVDAADDGEAERASDIIERYNPVDIDEREAQWRQSGWQPSLGKGDETKIPIVEEELHVGKREVQRGGIRVIARVSEKPVEETVNLREEHATVERRPVDRAPTESDQAFKEQSFEVRGTAEEAVVGKTSRVVEEVVIGKEGSTREQKIKDSVHKTDVEVEQLGQGSRSGQKTNGPDRRMKSSASYRGVERRGA
jgi:uncharacterized protein (TIGR02271 family)